ncbi:hypothetical protein GW901_00470 [Candidatus Parcubacteria bacterium]|nr:hypothetical protein [Candidatus Parcubacteria bacterium]
MIGSTFTENIRWNLEQIVVQFRHAEKVKGRARSGYYKAAIMLAASVVEALAFKILSESNLKMPLGDWQCKNSSFLPEFCQSKNGYKLSVCERIQPVFKLERNTDFKKVNEICLELKIFSKRFFKKIEKVRILRNKIHIQGLGNIDRSYTKKELEFVSSVMNELLNKLK